MTMPHAIGGGIGSHSDSGYAGLPDPPPAEAAMPPAIHIADVSYDTEEFRYRTPIKFGGVAVDRATLLNVRCVVRTADGRDVTGAGSMPLSNVWAFPSRRLDYATT